MLVTSRRIAALVMLVACAAIGAPAAQASTAAQPRGLLDLGGLVGGLLGGLTNILGGLLGTAQLRPLTQLTSTLTPGVTPSAQTLAPLTPLVSGLASNAGTPADIKSQAASVLALLNGGGTAPLSSDALGQITGLLGSLSLTQGLSSGQVSALNGVVAAIQSTVGTVAGGLPIIGPIVAPVGGAPVGTTLVTSLTDLASLLASGQVPTGLSLAPVTALLRQVAAGVPDPLRSTIDQLADAIDQTTGPLGADLLGPLSTVLGQIAGSAGVSPAAAAQLAPLAASLQRAVSNGAPLTSTPKPTKVVYSAARVSKVKVDRKKGRLDVSIVCDSVVNKCATVLTPLRGRSAAAKAIVVMVPAGGSVTRKIALSKGILRLMKRQTVKLTVVGTSQRGGTNRKTVVTKVPKHKH